MEIKQNKNLLLVILVVAIIIIASGIFLIFSNDPINNNPEGAIEGLTQSINNADGKDAADFTISKFGPSEEYDETVEFYHHMGLYIQVETHEVSVFYSEDMADNYHLEMQNVTHQLENDYNVEIQNYCYLNVSRTYNYWNGTVEYQGFRNFGCVQIDSLWYICPFDYYG